MSWWGAGPCPVPDAGPCPVLPAGPCPAGEWHPCSRYAQAPKGRVPALRGKRKEMRRINKGRLRERIGRLLLRNVKLWARPPGTITWLSGSMKLRRGAWTIIFTTLFLYSGARSGLSNTRHGWTYLNVQYTRYQSSFLLLLAKFSSIDRYLSFPPVPVPHASTGWQPNCLGSVGSPGKASRRGPQMLQRSKRCKQAHILRSCSFCGTWHAKPTNTANSFLQECGQEMMLRTERGLAMGPDQALSLQLDPQGAKEWVSFCNYVYAAFTEQWPEHSTQVRTVRQIQQWSSEKSNSWQRPSAQVWCGSLEIGECTLPVT